MKELIWKNKICEMICFVQLESHRDKSLAQYKEVPSGLKREALPRTEAGIYPAPILGAPTFEQDFILWLWSKK
jgi:hypothetical protein